MTRSGEPNGSRASLDTVIPEARSRGEGVQERPASTRRAADQVAMADFLLALADFDRRRLWVDLGYASLFAYLHRELGLSRSAAHYRKTAVELIERFPPVEAAFRSGRLCLTTSFEF